MRSRGLRWENMPDPCNETACLVAASKKKMALSPIRVGGLAEASRKTVTGEKRPRAVGRREESLRSFRRKKYVIANARVMTPPIR